MTQRTIWHDKQRYFVRLRISSRHLWKYHLKNDCPVHLHFQSRSWIFSVWSNYRHPRSLVNLLAFLDIINLVHAQNSPKTWCILTLYILTLRKKCPYLKLFWSILSRIRTEYGQILRISPYLVQMQKNKDQYNAKYGQLYVV